MCSWPKKCVFFGFFGPTSNSPWSPTNRTASTAIPYTQALAPLLLDKLAMASTCSRGIWLKSGFRLAMIKLYGMNMEWIVVMVIQPLGILTLPTIIPWCYDHGGHWQNWKLVVVQVIARKMMEVHPATLTNADSYKAPFFDIFCGVGVTFTHITQAVSLSKAQNTWFGQPQGPSQSEPAATTTHSSADQEDHHEKPGISKVKPTFTGLIQDVRDIEWKSTGNHCFLTKSQGGSCKCSFETSETCDIDS